MNKETFILELKKLDINISKEKLEKLEIYYNTLVEENKKYNLTSITEKELVYLKHFYDSLTIAKIVNLSNQSVCDIGTGAGFPGIVLKIFYPSIKLILIESNKKKCNFLKLISNKLELNNIIIINERAEEFAKENREKYDIVVSRAVAPLTHLLEYGIPLLKVNGEFIAMRGNIKNENDDIVNYLSKLSLDLLSIKEFTLPIESSNRSLIMFAKKEKTNKRYPRKYSEIKKRCI